jgi:hypothetical protein
VAIGVSAVAREHVPAGDTVQEHVGERRLYGLANIAGIGIRGLLAHYHGPCGLHMAGRARIDEGGPLRGRPARRRQPNSMRRTCDEALNVAIHLRSAHQQ